MLAADSANVSAQRSELSAVPYHVHIQHHDPWRCVREPRHLVCLSPPPTVPLLCQPRIAKKPLRSR
eukprot:5067862-Pyramimonas_sp.AAC.1